MPVSPVMKIVYETQIGKWRIRVNALGGLFLQGPRGKEVYIPPGEPPENYRLPNYVKKGIQRLKKKETKLYRLI